MPDVSVVIPFFAGADWLEEAIESAVRQTHKDAEIILVNDGSQEDIGRIVDRYSGRIRYFHKDNGGPGSARNFGLEKAVGKYVAFLDSDDLWDERKLEVQTAVMETTGAVWSHTSYRLFRSGEGSTAGRTVDVSSYRGDVFPRCLWSAPIATPCVMVRMDVLRERPELRFSEKMRYGQDSLFWINLAVRYPLEAVPEVLTRVRIRGANAARRARVQLQAKAQIWEEFFRGGCLPERKRVDGVTRAAYRICHGGNAFVKRIEQRGRLGNRAAERVSRFLYFFPYALLKLRCFLFSRPEVRRDS